MKNLSLTLLIFLMFAFTVVGQQGNTYFVKENGSDQANGTSWSDALTLQAALTKAGDYDEIRIAKGVYKPSVNPVVGAGHDDDRNQTFLITNNVKIYGGFRGDNENEPLEARDLINNKTILSGDIGTTGDNTDNTYHVVVIVGISDIDRIGPTLNGLTITGGYSDGNDNVEMTINSLPIKKREGGGIHNRYANTIIENVTITGNHAWYGGGIYNENSDVKLNSVTVSDNIAYPGGGGIFNNHSPITLTNVSIVNNESKLSNSIKEGGGGMYNDYSSTTLTNVTIAGNKAAGYGGGIYTVFHSSSNIRNSIILGNKAGLGGNNVASSNISPLEYHHTLLEGDEPEDQNGNIYANQDAQIFVNYISPASSNLPTSAGNYRLAAGSPAIDKGSTEYGITTDLDGEQRDDKPDMGAYEYQVIPGSVDGQSVLYVNADPNLNGQRTGSSWSTALPTLGEALDYINANYSVPLEGYTINVAGGTYYPTTKVKDDHNQTTTDRDKAFLLLSDVAIYGGYSGKDDNERDIKQYKTILSGDIDNTPGQSDGDAYHVVVMVGSNNRITPTLNGLTITGGNAFGSTSLTINGQEIVRYRGGGIHNRLANPYIQDVTIIGNKARTSGGGILNLSSSPAITNVLITGNRSIIGGGMANTNSGPILTNVTISGNYASGDDDNPGMGGGIVSLQAYNTIIRNSIIWGNIAEDNAAGNDIINLDESNPQFYHSLVGGDGDWNSDWGTGDDTNIIAGPETHLFVGYIDPTQAPTTEGDYHLYSDSPATGTGSKDYYSEPNLSLITTDIEGESRFTGELINMGAYEKTIETSSNPAPSPNPPLQYTVTIPAIEGVTTTPGAGLHEVKPGNSFEISITPGDEYDESELLIYANDILLQPVATGSEPVSYTYRIESVETAVTFRIEGVQKNDEVTGIDSPGSTPNYRLYTQPGLLMIDALLPGHLTITAIDGRTITRQRITEGTTRVELPAGVYIVRIGDGKYKVVVRSK